MNANELINKNKLVEVLEGAKLVIVRLNDMLRQQQAEIEALKEKVKQKADLKEKMDFCKKKLKPVAELVLEQMAVGDASSLRVKWLTDSYPPVGTKLYTHPVKELTEDMLWEFAEEFLDTDAPWGEANVTGIPHFIEAILKKAQEK
jgi:hypothetical protein